MDLNELLSLKARLYSYLDEIPRLSREHRILHELIVSEISHNIDNFCLIRQQSLINAEICLLAQEKGVSIIPFGEDCFPRTFLTRWGLIKCKKDNRITLPFDLAVHPLPGLSAAIKDGFKSYLNPAHLILNESNHIINEYYGFIFNHERCRNESEIPIFLANQERRLNSLKLQLKGSIHPVFIVRHNASEVESALSSIQEMPLLISNYFNIVSFTIIVICNNARLAEGISEINLLAKLSVGKGNADIRIHSIAFNQPQNYVFYNASSIFEQECYNYELRVMKRIRSIIHDIVSSL